MPRSLFSYALLPLILFCFWGEGVSAQNVLRNGIGVTNYTPPRRGLVGYTNGNSRQDRRKTAAPSDLVAPPEIGAAESGSNAGNRFFVSGSPSDGEVITFSSPYLSHRLNDTMPAGQVKKTASVSQWGAVSGGYLTDGGFIPERSEPSSLTSAPNTYILTSGMGTSPNGVWDGGNNPGLPAPVLDAPPSGYYSAIGDDGQYEEESAVSDFFLMPTIRRQGFFQQIHGGIEYIPNVGKRKSGMTTFGASVRFALPFPDKDHPLMVTPHFAWTDFSFPEYLVPIFGRKAGLYTGGLQGDWLFPVSPCFMFNLGFGASWNSDLKTSSSDSLRFTGRVVGVWRLDETTHLQLGASYQNISDWKVVPVFGITWKPNENSYLDATFPMAKAGRRITQMQGLPASENGESPYWVYVTGGLSGGGRWAIKPDGEERSLWGTNALVSYYDYRILGGLEKKMLGEVNWAVEGGLVFARHLEIEGWTPTGYRDEKPRPKPAGIVRLNLTY